MSQPEVKTQVPRRRPGSAGLEATRHEDNTCSAVVRELWNVLLSLVVAEMWLCVGLATSSGRSTDQDRGGTSHGLQCCSTQAGETSFHSWGCHGQVLCIGGQCLCCGCGGETIVRTNRGPWKLDNIPSVLGSVSWLNVSTRLLLHLH